MPPDGLSLAGIGRIVTSHMLITSFFVAATFACPPQDPDAEPAPQDPKVHTTASGLKYKVLARGVDQPDEGGDVPENADATPKMGDTVTVHYTGTLTDGTVFDSSRERDGPATFMLGRVIPGWNEGLQLMRPGDRFEFTIPSDLGYGERGSPPKIPGGATLVFDVELIKFDKALVPWPEFKPGNPAKQKKTVSGVVYEVIKQGEGEACGDGDVVELGYAFFNDEGRIFECSESGANARSEGNFINGKIETLPLAFMKDVVPLMKVGDRIRCEVPPVLAFGAPDRAGRGSPLEKVKTVWELELRKSTPAPKAPAFQKLDPNVTITTDSGLKYQVLREGDGGDKPTATTRVTVHYCGWLTDGTKFDSSYDRGQTTSFALNGVIKGWTEGLQLMDEGAIYLFEIPGELAYGTRGSPPKIGPNATLIFQVELVSF